MKDLHINKKRIWIRLFFKQYVWIVVPLCFLGAFKSCSTYIEAGTYLTPKTIIVSGYTRIDGTYVRPYKRRPPGGAIHDAPYERRRGIMVLLFSGCLMVSGISVKYYIHTSKRKISSEQKRIEELEKQRILKEKDELLKNILKKMNFDFKELEIVPSNISFNSSFRCKFCEEYKRHYECHIAFKARINIHHVCIECAKKSAYIGKSQPIKDFLNELNYAERYKRKKTEFLYSFRNMNNSGTHKFYDHEIITLFIEELQTAVNK